ncbi:L,D-transpeptidase [Microbacterium halotolerans]|uniref:L,D-transpeptidase n=1 Tax=Microbacterium halotolerans TaxID=246613 RepID=UPI000E6ACF8D|nr:L,D-transpeptidase [Microbacterium halotolerans]
MSKRAVGIAGIVVATLVVVAMIPLAVIWVRGITAQPSADPAPTPTATVDPSPTPSGPAENSSSYSADDYPVVDVFMVNGALPVDDAPDEPAIGVTATPDEVDGAAVFADPAEDPVAWLPQKQRYGGTVVPVIEQHDHWVKVLLVGRQARAGDGDAGQLTGWLRADDVQLEGLDSSVEVDLGAGTVDIVTGAGDDARRETIATDFAWGTDATPTPKGRSFVMMTEVTSFAYARGHPIVYLSVQSSTLAGFGGQDVAITAFHYHDVRSGAISNGCIRVDADAITKLAALPEGTPIYVS